jgi:hypothetical protein
MQQPELSRLLEAVKPHPLLHSVVLESMSDEEWVQYITEMENARVEPVNKPGQDEHTQRSRKPENERKGGAHQRR